MVGYSFFDHIYMMHLFFAEYWVIEGIQFMLVSGGNGIEFNALSISRVILHITIVVLIYLLCVKSISDRAESAEFGHQ